MKFMKLMKLVIFFVLGIKTHERDRENQQKDLLISMKSQSFSTYQSFRPRDLFPHLKDLLILLIVVKSLDTSMSAHIRINCFEVRQWSVWVTRPHVLHELSIHPEHDKDVNLLGWRGMSPEILRS